MCYSKPGDVCVLARAGKVGGGGEEESKRVAGHVCLCMCVLITDITVWVLSQCM